MKLDNTLSLINEAVLANGGSKELAAKVMNDIRKAAAEEAEDRKAASPKGKTALHIVVTDPDGKLKGLTLQGFVLQTEDLASVQQAYERVLRSAADFNQSKRGRKVPVESFGDACTVLKGRWLRQEDGQSKLVIRTRTPCAVLAVPNALPR